MLDLLSEVLIDCDPVTEFFVATFNPALVLDRDDTTFLFCVESLHSMTSNPGGHNMQDKQSLDMLCRT